MYRELLLGCGFRRTRIIDPYAWTSTPPPSEPRWQHVTAVDGNPRCNPDVVMDVGGLYVWAVEVPSTHQELFQPHPLVSEACRFQPNLFHEVHAYEVLEHLGQQGDYKSFFRHFDEYWRVLVPEGYLCATVPSRYSSWMWGDPGHRRAILPETLAFLNRPHYDQHVGTSPSSDYRGDFESDWETVVSEDNGSVHAFVLKAVKPPRPPQPLRSASR